MYVKRAEDFNYAQASRHDPVCTEAAGMDDAVSPAWAKSNQTVVCRIMRACSGLLFRDKCPPVHRLTYNVVDSEKLLTPQNPPKIDTSQKTQQKLNFEFYSVGGRGKMYKKWGGKMDNYI